MDKQKQILEMSKVIEEAMAKARRTLGGHNNIATFYAEILLNAGYCKIPEGAVVLTREQYEKDLAIERELGERKASRARKETAEKFAEMVSKAFMSVNCIDIDEWNWYQRKIDEICEEISEGKV